MNILQPSINRLGTASALNRSKRLAQESAVVSGVNNRIQKQQTIQSNFQLGTPIQTLNKYILELDETNKTEEKDITSERESMMAKLADMHEQMRQARETAKAKGEALRIQMKALEIAMRIIRGDNVPHPDHQFLLEHDPGLYMKATSLRMPNDDPTDYDSLTDREYRNNLSLPELNIPSGDASVSVSAGSNVDISL